MPTWFTSVRTGCSSTNPPMMLWKCGQKASTAWRSWKRRTKLSFVQKEWRASASCYLQFTRRCLHLHSEDLFQYMSTVVVPIRGHKPGSNSATIRSGLGRHWTFPLRHSCRLCLCVLPSNAGPCTDCMTLPCVRVVQYITILITACVPVPFHVYVTVHRVHSQVTVVTSALTLP